MVAARSCGNSDCNFDEDGVCVEDQDPEICRFRSGRVMIADVEGDFPDKDEGGAAGHTEDEEGAIDREAGRDGEGDFDGIHLPSGLRLDTADCRALREVGPTRVVSILAPKDAGKTSLIAGLYGLFLDGVADGFSYSGSTTLYGLERLCHLSRAASNRTVNDMVRTRRAEGLGFYHLSIDRLGRRLGLLLADRPGETVREAAHGIQTAAALTELPSAEIIAYLIDGALLLEPATRHLAQSDAEAILETIAAAGQFAQRPRLALVLTKADRVEAAGVGQRFDQIVDALTRRFEDRFAEIVAFRTAANAEVLEVEGSVAGPATPLANAATPSLPTTDALSADTFVSDDPTADAPNGDIPEDKASKAAGLAPDAVPLGGRIGRGFGLNELMIYFLDGAAPVRAATASTSQPTRQYGSFGREGARR